MWGRLMVKCIVTDCNKEAEIGIPWCEEHLNELGDYIDEHPIGGYNCENGCCNIKIEDI